MKAAWIVAINTFVEILRNRILVGIVVFAVLMMAFSLLLGQLSFAEQARISMNFGLSAIQLSAVVLSIFVGSTLVSREIEKQTILTLLVRPLSRFQFLLGKALGLALVNLLVIGCLSLVLYAVLLSLDVPLSFAFFFGLGGILFEALVILGVALFFSTFSTPFMVVTFTVGVWLIGHWMQSLKHFTGKSEDVMLLGLAKVLELVFPNLELFNWKSAAVYADNVAIGDFLLAGANSLAWFGVLVLGAAVVFRRKDFV